MFYQKGRMYRQLMFQLNLLQVVYVHVSDSTFIWGISKYILITADFLKYYNSSHKDSKAALLVSLDDRHQSHEQNIF